MLRRHRTIRVLLQDAPPWLYGCAAALSAFMLAVVSLYSVSEVSTRVLKATVDEQLLSMATLCASLIDAEKHSTLQAPEQQNGETYEAVVSPLRAMAKATPQIKYVYTVRMAADGPRFGVDAAEAVDGDGDGVIDQAGLNEFYEDPDETLLAAFATKAARVCEKPFTDKWGTFMSGFAPVRRADGRFECIVGVDMDANEYFGRVEAMRRTANVGACIAAFASAGFGFAVFALRRRRGTEQRMVHALAESESRFRTLIEGSDVVMWEYDVGADAFTYVSPQAAKLGYALDEWRRPRFWRDLIHADDAESAAELRRVCVERREPHRFQYRMLAADRSTVWIDDVSSAPEEVDGRLMLRGVLVDITDRIVAAERQEAALSLATRLSSAADTREAARIVNDSLTKMVGVHRSAVLLYDDEGCCRFVGWRNLSRDYRRAVEGHCPWKRGERGAEPIVVDDCDTDPSLAPYRGVLRGESIRSLAFIPIMTGEGVVGKLMLYGAEAHAFSARQIASTAEAAVYLGVAAGRLQAQERLTASEARLRTIIDTALDAVVSTDEDGTISAWNRQAEITFGWTAAEAIGRRLQDLAMPAVGSSLGSLAGRRIEVPARTKAGAEITVEISIAPIRQSGTLAFSAFIRDISERIRIESERAAEAAELRRERERLDLTVRGAGLGTWEWDVERSVVTTNNRSSTMLGYEPAEISESVAAWIELVHPDDRAEVEASVTAALLGVSADYRCEHRFRRKDGTWAWVLDAGRITERAPDGRALRACGVHVDVSSAHELAERLAKARDAAEAATRAKSEFLANMSHEIRTPMTAILGYAELLNEDDGGPDASARRRERVEVIRHNGEHLLALINDILDISKIEAGKLVIDRSEAEPLAIARDVIALMQPKADERGIALRLEQATPTPRRIRTDPLRLRQILVNLVGNAIKFTARGHVTLRLSFGASAGEPRQLRFEVIDTGIGMAPDVVSRLFHAFEQADASTTRKFGGTGLGLCICKRLAELLNGDVVVESELGKGSTFTLAIAVPAEEALTLALPEETGVRAPERPRRVPTSASPLEGVRIIVAEDGPDNRRLIEHFLTKAGASVRVVENGSLLVRELTTDGSLEGPLVSPLPYDLVISDMQMPELDGYAAATLLRAKGLARPIIALTAHAMSGDEEKCLAAGCDRYVTKPINRALLVGACLDACDASPAALRRAA
ncbi:MAG: PAS domain S-box protein [Phycisphaerae bacterium]|nr:PAS domain S-box protein [Phycisphaerae bacterium]